MTTRARMTTRSLLTCLRTQVIGCMIPRRNAARNATATSTTNVLGNNPNSGQWFKANSGVCVQRGDGLNRADQWKTTHNTAKQCCKAETAWKDCKNL
mmetsp:Transcript_37845/g.91227  ORF Transcript_37845/g.91227 Transcript_37845/m.91227 type:complete len:97 (+) Transcript_37845:190-480(+)